MKIRTTGADLVMWADGEVDRTDGQTHMTKLRVAFRNLGGGGGIGKNCRFMTSSSSLRIRLFIQFLKKLSIMTNIRVNFMLLKDTQTS